MSTVRILSFSFLFLLVTAEYANGQDPSFRQFQVKDGLPSSEIYDVLIDRLGDVWVTTDRGVSRFNGYEFQNFSKLDGLTDNTIFKVYEDHLGRIWFLAHGGTICYFQNGQFFAHPLNEKLSSYGANIWWEAIEVNPDNSIVLHERKTIRPILNKYLYVNPEWNTIQEIEYSSKPENYSSQIIIDDKSIIEKDIATNKWIYLAKVHYPTEIDLDVFKKYTTEEITFRDSLVILNVTGFRQNEFLGYNSRIVLIKGDQLMGTYTTYDFINHIYSDNDKILVATDNGVLSFNTEDISSPIRTYLNNSRISAIERDSENNYWVTSLDKGLFHLPNFNVFSITKNEHDNDLGQVFELSFFQDQLILGTSGMEVIAYDRNFKANTFYKSPGETPYHLTAFEDVLLIPHNTRIITSNFQSVTAGQYYGLSPTLEIYDDFFIMSTSSEIFKLPYPFSIDYMNNRGLYRKYTPSKILDFSNLNDSVTIASDLRGIHKINWNLAIDYEKIDIDNVFQNPKITSIVALDEQSFLFATSGEGVGLMVNDQLFKYTIEDGISGNFINELYLENENKLWVCTNSGLDFINFEFDQNGLHIKDIQNFSTYDGLISNYILTVTRWEDNIIVGTDQGMSYFNPEKTKDIYPAPHLSIRNIFVNEKNINRDSIHHFAYNENDFEFRFSANGMKRPQKQKLYHYHLITKNNTKSNWSSTNNREIRFSNLPAGDYVFEVKAMNNSGTLFSNIDKYQFHISPYFTNTLWFKTLLALLAIALIILYFWRRINRLKEQTSFEHIQQKNLLKINEAQLSALRSQMNPHFIFNSLNAIQNFIFKKDVRQANHFLAKFSRLVRTSLTLSKLEAIPLAQEIAFLQDYIELEQMRFPAKFDYEIIIGEGMDPEETIVPPLLLQPLLENSIRHGFKGLERKGLLIIQFEQDENQLKIYLKDNGIGLKASSQNNTNKFTHNSFAIQIIKERIYLINERNENQKASFLINNNLNDQGEVIGVVAMLFLPSTI